MEYGESFVFLYLLRNDYYLLTFIKDSIMVKKILLAAILLAGVSVMNAQTKSTAKKTTATKASTTSAVKMVSSTWAELSVSPGVQ